MSESEALELKIEPKEVATKEIEKDLLNGEKVTEEKVENSLNYELLTDEEKVQMCEIVDKSGADFIKTSTGFSTAGATFEDVKLFKDNLQGSNLKIKAAGGIKSFDDAEKFIEFGADRIGTSRLI